MIRNILTHIGGIENYGILSLCLFVTVFTGMLIWTFCLKRSALDARARLPLDPETDHSETRLNSHE